MHKTKCGCLYCKGQSIPTTRGGWKALKNRHGRTYGRHPKPTKNIK